MHGGAIRKAQFGSWQERRRGRRVEESAQSPNSTTFRCFLFQMAPYAAVPAAIFGVIRLAYELAGVSRLVEWQKSRSCTSTN